MAAQATKRRQPGVGVDDERRRGSKTRGGRTYPELVAAHPLKPIRSQAELDRAVAVLNSLIDREMTSPATPDERDYQQVLAILIGHYEADRQPVATVSPAEMLRHLLDARDITQAQLAAGVGVSESTVSEILAGKRPVSTKNRRLFSEYLKADPAVFV